MLFSHNVNLRDLAFQPDDYEFMSHYKHPRHDESEHLAGYSPRELEPKTPTSLQLDRELLLSSASLYPKIFNSMIKKSELSTVMLMKKPLITPIGKLKSIKLLQFDLATFDTRELYEYLGSDSYQDLPQVITYPSDLQSKLLFYLSDIIEEIAIVGDG